MEQNSRRAVATVESCFAAIAALDADRLVAHHLEDYVLELPNPQAPRASAIG